MVSGAFFLFAPNEVVQLVQVVQKQDWAAETGILLNLYQSAVEANIMLQDLGLTPLFNSKE